MHRSQKAFFAVWRPKLHYRTIIARSSEFTYKFTYDHCTKIVAFYYPTASLRQIAELEIISKTYSVCTIFFPVKIAEKSYGDRMAIVRASCDVVRVPHGYRSASRHPHGLPTINLKIYIVYVLVRYPCGALQGPYAHRTVIVRAS